MMPDRTSPVPAVANRASPAAAMSGPPVGGGDYRCRALQQHDGAAAGGGAPRLGQAVGAGRMTGQPGELAVVRRYHRGLGPSGHDGGQRVQGADGVEAVGVDDGGHGGAGGEQAHLAPGQSAATLLAVRPVPDHRAETGADDQGLDPRQLLEYGGVPAGGRHRQVDQLPRGKDRGLDPGHGQAHVAGAGSQRGPADEPRGTRHARGPGHDLDGRLPFVPVPGPARQHGGYIGVADQPAPGDGVDQAAEPDVGHFHVAGHIGAGAEQQARLQRGKGDGGCRRHRPASLEHPPVSPETPEGMSTARTGALPGEGGEYDRCRPGAIGGVDNQVRQWAEVARAGATPPRGPGPPPPGGQGPRRRPGHRRRCCLCRRRPLCAWRKHPTAGPRPGGRRPPRPGR